MLRQYESTGDPTLEPCFVSPAQPQRLSFNIEGTDGDYMGTLDSFFTLSL